MTKEERDEEIKGMKTNFVDSLFKTIPLGNSIYEFTYWVMYHEDNPIMLMELVQKSMMAYAITLVITLYYLEARMKVLEGGIYFGTWELNIVRGIAILLMHMSMYPNFRDSRNMLQFAINNVERFAGAQITLPIMLCLFKLSIAMLTEFGQIVLVMHYKTEY